MVCFLKFEFIETLNANDIQMITVMVVFIFHYHVILIADPHTACVFNLFYYTVSWPTYCRLLVYKDHDFPTFMFCRGYCVYHRQ